MFLYPYIISNILTAVLPEQAGIWSYPRSEHMNEKDIMKDKMKVICYHSKTNNRWHASYCYYKDENSEIDDSEDLEKHMKLLDDNKISRWESVFCYTWSMSNCTVFPR